MAQPSGEPLSHPVAVIGPQYCAPYPIDLAIVRKIFEAKGGSFAVTDVKGNVLLAVKEKFFTFLRKRKTILDAAGNPILTLRQKAMSAHSKWRAFRGDSSDDKDILFTVRKHSILYLKLKLDVFLANNTEQKVCDFKVKGSFFQRSWTVYAGDKDSSTVVAQMHKKLTAGSIFLGKDQFDVTVYPNIDYAFIAALIVILDDICAAQSAGSSGGSSSSGM